MGIVNKVNSKGNLYINAFRELVVKRAFDERNLSGFF